MIVDSLKNLVKYEKFIPDDVVKFISDLTPDFECGKYILNQTDYVNVKDEVLYECRAKGAFRKENVTPLVGDDVEFDIISEEKKEGIIRSILDRSCELIRPACANIDQVLIVFAATEPEPNLNLLDRFLIMMKKQNIPTILCFNKTDIAGNDELALLAE